MKRFDVLVLGGGAAGCVLASRLSENRDRTVCLVEAGPDYGPYTEGRWPADILDARRLARFCAELERLAGEERLAEAGELFDKVVGEYGRVCFVLDQEKKR